MTTTEAPATLFIGGRVMTMAPRLRADLVVLEGELDPKNPPALGRDLGCGAAGLSVGSLAWPT